MATAFDVAAYILEKYGPMTHMKLQKLLYYSQAWSLVWDEAPLFEDRIEAWVNGPVVRRIYGKLRKSFKINREMLEDGNPAVLSDAQRETVDKVVEFYGHRDSQWLSDLTHSEAPWLESRIGLGPREGGDREISLAKMAEYYGSL